MLLLGVLPKRLSLVNTLVVLTLKPLVLQSHMVPNAQNHLDRSHMELIIVQWAWDIKDYVCLKGHMSHGLDMSMLNGKLHRRH